MSERPTTRDEAWRYADASVLESLAPAAFDAWREIAVPAGESMCETLVLEGNAPDLRRIRINVGAGARFDMFAVNACADYARVEIVVHLGRGAHFEFGGVTIGGGDTTREFVTRIDHAVPEATSNQVIRAVHWGKATGNFIGAIDVARDAQKTDAAQDFKGLLLTRGASANAKPELEIFADDVKCAHGAAIGALDDRAAFYMAARGIPPHIARKLLVRAFVADAFAEMTDEVDQQAMLESALAVLKGAEL